MAENKFKPSTKLALAIGLVMEQNPADWGAAEHMNMLRYLVLQCSTPETAKLTLKQIKALPAEAELIVSWADLRTEMLQAGKLAECANLKKALVADYPQLGKTKAAAYA